MLCILLMRHTLLVLLVPIQLVEIRLVNYAAQGNIQLRGPVAALCVLPALILQAIALLVKLAHPTSTLLLEQVCVLLVLLDFSLTLELLAATAPSPCSILVLLASMPLQENDVGCVLPGLTVIQAVNIATPVVLEHSPRKGHLYVTLVLLALIRRFLGIDVITVRQTFCSPGDPLALRLALLAIACAC